MTRADLIAMAIRAIGPKFSSYRPESDFELLLNSMFGTETRDQRLAREIDNDLTRATEAAKRINVNRKFKKIVQKF